jgi:RNA polymerase sigma-70 factor (ECF subfamily)
MAGGASERLAGTEATTRESAGPKDVTATDDEVLLARCGEGDGEAFGEIVAKYQDRVYNLVYRMCGRRADAEELVQETFLRAFRKIGEFRARSQLYTWLFRIASNTTISHCRRRAKVKFHPFAFGDGADDEGGAAEVLTASLAGRRDPGPEEAAVAGETQRRVEAALASLDEEHRLVAVLSDIEQMDYAQIADVLDVPVGTVKSRLHRARCMLRRKLRDLV